MALNPLTKRRNGKLTELVTFLKRGTNPWIKGDDKHEWQRKLLMTSFNREGKGKIILRTYVGRLGCSRTSI